jgi:flavin-dependent dehydrogenase
MGLVAHFVGKPNLRDGFGQMHVRPDGYCGVAPLPDGLVNVSLVVPTNALQRAHLSATALFDRWIAETPRLRACLADCRRVSPVRGVSPLGSRARRAHVSGALLVGDAAGFFDPFTGEGIYRALRGAELAVQTAHASLAVDDVSSSNLVSYDHMRMRAFGAKELVTRLVQLFVQFPSLMTYSLPRMSERQDSSRALSAVLGDIQEANISLTARALWSALRP